MINIETRNISTEKLMTSIMLQIINEKMFRNSKITKEQKEKIGNMIISIK